MADAYTLFEVSFGYTALPVLSRLDLSIASGKLTAVVGPNGSGKSTLLDLLAGYRSPQTGRIRFGDRRISDYPQMELARLIAVAPQEFGFKFPFTLREAVLMGRHPHVPRFSTPSAQDQDVVDMALQAMDLNALAHRPVSELSGGERQRTVMARTLAQQAPVLLLDEPTSSMDIRHALTLLQELKRLAGQEERTVIAVLHDLNLAASFADEIVLLKDGVVHAQGPVADSLTPENVRSVFGVGCAVRWDTFAGSLSVSYRMEP